jgi:hypothetical protein
MLTGIKPKCGHRVDLAGFDPKQASCVSAWQFFRGKTAGLWLPALGTLKGTLRSAITF